MPKDVAYGRTIRKSFAKSEEIMEMPNLLEIQKDSYKWFLETGLREVFNDVSAITDYTGNLELTFDAREVWGHGFAHMVLRQNLASLAARPGSRSTALRSGATVSDSAWASPLRRSRT